MPLTQNWDVDRLKWVDSFGKLVHGNFSVYSSFGPDVPHKFINLQFKLGATTSGNDSSLPCTARRDAFHSRGFFFDRSQWVKSKHHPKGITPARYEALTDVFSVASNFLKLEVVREYMTLFLSRDPSKAPFIRNGNGPGIKVIDRIPRRQLGSHQLRLAANIAENCFREISSDVYWTEDPDMFANINVRHAGITIIGHPHTDNTQFQTGNSHSDVENCRFES